MPHNMRTGKLPANCAICASAIAHHCQTALGGSQHGDVHRYGQRGVIAQRRGWMDEAAQNFRIAVNMDSQNYEYRNAANAASGAGAYTYRQQEYGNSQSDDLCNLCGSLMCLNCLCDCCR